MLERKIVILIVLLLFISGCAAIQNLTDMSLFGKKDFVSGKGLTPEFLLKMPPLDKMPEGQEFQVGIKVTNYGLSDAIGEICVFDSLSSNYDGIPSKQNTCVGFNMDAAEKSTVGSKIIPTSERFFFPGERSYYVYKNLISDTKTKIESEIRYDYKTKFNSQICISKKEDDPCNSRVIGMDESVKFAPLDISSIKKDILPTPIGYDDVKLILEIHIRNVGGGKIYNEYDSKKQFFDIDVVLESGSSINCNPKKEGRFFLEDNGEVIVTCDITSSFSGEYIDDPLEIVLSYPYKISQKTGEILINHKED
ncbi:hypothetical protein CL621_04775 [archaeon]|nr:hypothetical protein [archaeon]